MPFEREEEVVLVEHGDMFGVPFSKPQTLNPKKKSTDHAGDQENPVAAMEAADKEIAAVEDGGSGHSV